ncbi:MAG: hypothetical protein Q7V04_00960, partial [Deltaproteobacteria bacterium]|nr:hypothetical protein [Deltaproteobacteria bacterium]
MKLFNVLICFIFFINVLLPLPAVSVSPQTVRIAAFNLYPTIFKAGDGTIQGFYVDFLKEIAKKEGW